MASHELTPGRRAELEARLLAHVPTDGTAIGNQSLAEQCGLAAPDFEAVRQGLIERGVLEKGRGRGGSVKRAAASSAATPSAPAKPLTELFAPAEIESEIPELARAQRAAAQMKAEAKKADDGTPVTEHRHADATRKHIPAAGTDVTAELKDEAKIRFAYDPHRPPVLRFNELIVRQRELLRESTRRTLTQEEAAELAAQIESPQPWLEWAGKRETPEFTVAPVALHIHERVSAQAILRAVRHEDVQRDMFGSSSKAQEPRGYYQYDVDWANRLILGDSLQVMTSLARREGLAGQVQMIYLDPPYGIKFSSNWQNEVGKRDVKNKDEDLTREPEMIRAYRDTWTLGVHSYLAYLKQRLLLARELLTDSGSVFVQISDENLHRVRAVMDEVFGAENFCAQIVVEKTSSASSETLSGICDYLLWFARDLPKAKYRQIFREKRLGMEGATQYVSAELPDGTFEKRLSTKELEGSAPLGEGYRVFACDNLTSQRPLQGADVREFAFRGMVFTPGKGTFKTDLNGLTRLGQANRLRPIGNSLMYKRVLEDFPVSPVANVWDDTKMTGFSDDKLYVVQTASKTIDRCMLMTTDPGDLVLDPTCGSGTTAFVAEQWGRRWITVDSSRVAAAIARQRLLTAYFETYKTRDPQAGVDPNQPLNPRHGFHYKTVPHITLKSIAQNKGLDPIFARHEPILAERLAALNAALETHAKAQSREGDELRRKLAGKLLAKLRESARSVTDADERRWILPGTDPQLFQAAKGGPTAKQVADLRAFASARATQWQEWEVPFDTDPDWPQPLQASLSAYRAAWRAKMDEVNKCIEANAEQEELVDVPEKVPGVVRVSGPFTVESIRPPESSLKGDLDDSTPIGGAPEELETFEATEAPSRDVTNAASHIDRMLALLKHDGITFLGNKHVKFSRLDPIESSFLHAEGEFTGEDGQEVKVAVVIGPEFGGMPALQAEEALDLAKVRGVHVLVLAAFSFDAFAQEKIQENNDRREARIRKGSSPEKAGPLAHLAQIRPDVTMGDLLKKSQTTAQIFTVFGQPRTRVETKGEESIVHMEGVDIYDPVKNAIDATSASKVAAWFLDTDYDGKVFCICQAFFPDKSAWEKLARALKTSVAEDAFATLTGTKSLPFKPGARKVIAVKVIDPRGNEVMRVHRLDGTYGPGDKG